MGRRVEVPLSPAVLAWAIREGGYSRTDFAERLKVEADTLTSWLEGDSRPSKTEFSRIVTTLKRPSALFFREDPPASTVPPELRSEPAGGRSLGPAELRKVRSTLRMQRVISEWLQHGDADIVKLPKLQTTMSPDLVGRILRTKLKVDVDEQLSWETPTIAFAAWRTALSDLGIQVFQLQLGAEGIRGFSSWNDWLPIIGVNTAYNTQARTFTVFHELAHLVARESAACTDVSPQPKKSPHLERWCEKVAAATLLPSGAVTETFSQVVSGDLFATVEAVAKAFGVSLRAAAIRIGDLGLVEDSDGLYQLVDSTAIVWDREKGFARSTKTRDRVAQRLSEVGPVIVSMFDQALASGYVHERDLQDHIRLDPVEFEEAKSRLDLAG